MLDKYNRKGFDQLDTRKNLHIARLSKQTHNHALLLREERLQVRLGGIGKHLLRLTLEQDRYVAARNLLDN